MTILFCLAIKGVRKFKVSQARKSKLFFFQPIGGVWSNGYPTERQAIAAALEYIERTEGTLPAVDEVAIVPFISHRAATPCLALADKILKNVQKNAKAF